ncbi:DedA family protein [Phosphitispora fastidiosa]|uniref:DedA family protein n=1 Tax=Phosphitispora fastidiosa TaxID=2837202 RepID=UPI001E361474|nr:DedA family protein [Phosphitispora fastidiosa]MBU7005345.1 membrane protein DedA with SNARE-associated domain [Phosphitispora fastidiosa]
MFSWLEQILKNDLEQYRLLAIYVMMTLESACIPIPSEIVMPYAGHLAAKGKLGIMQAALVASVANLSGSWLAYAVGRYGGRAFIDRYGRYIFLSKKHLNQADYWFARRGEITVFLSRMLPAVRTFISLPAGIAKMDFFKFSFYSFLGSLPWNLALVYLGYIFTDKWDVLQKHLHEFNIIVFAVIGLFAALFLVIRKRKRR